VDDLRLATWNVLHGRSLTHGQVVLDDLRAGAAALDADVVALQEVDRHQPRSHDVDQVREVADVLGARWFRFVPTLWGEPGVTWERARDGDEDAPSSARSAYGIGLVSRRPVLAWAVRRFPPARVGMPLLVPGRGITMVDDEPRVAVAALVDGPAGPLTVVATHLSFVPGVNVRQLQTVTRWAEGYPGPRVLLGDLNLPGRLPSWVSGWRQLGRVATYPSWRPLVQFDHALAHGLGPQAEPQVTSRRLPVSDHRPLVVTLTTRMRPARRT
jgi:endonuclease/exonuclease/phosphatase family metal-dependent hydrolase